MHLAKVDSFMKGVSRRHRAPLTPAGRRGGRQRRQTPGAKAAALEFEEASIQAVRSRQPAGGAGGAWRWRPEQRLHDARAVVCAVHDARHADPDGLWISISGPRKWSLVGS